MATICGGSRSSEEGQKLFAAWFLVLDPSIAVVLKLGQQLKSLLEHGRGPLAPVLPSLRLKWGPSACAL